MKASNPSPLLRIRLPLILAPILAPFLALTALPTGVLAARTQSNQARGPRAPSTSASTKKIKITKSYVISAILPRQGIPLASYRPRPLRVFGHRPRATVCPDPAVLRRIIRKARRDLSRCYRKHLLSRHPKRQGRVVVGFTINTRGRVTAVRVRRSALRDRPTERCLARVLGKLRFPALGAIIHVVYPFFFRPK